MSRYEVRKVFHSQWRETREREESNPWRGWIASPVIPSIHGSLSSSLRSTFVVQLTTMLLHNNSRHARHPSTFCGNRAFLFASRGLTSKVSFPITFLVILTIYIPVIYKRKNKCSLRDLDLFLYIINTYIIICFYVFLYPVFYYCFLLSHFLVQSDNYRR